MTAFKVERGHEMLKRRAGTKQPLAYPFDVMSIGDSFFVPDDGPHIGRRISMAAYGYGRRNCGEKFARRETEEEGRKGWRVWRTA